MPSLRERGSSFVTQRCSAAEGFSTADAPPRPHARSSGTSTQRLRQFQGAAGYVEAVKQKRTELGGAVMTPGKRAALPESLQPGVAQQTVQKIVALPTSEHIPHHNSLDDATYSLQFVGSIAHASAQQATAASHMPSQRTALNDPGPAFAEYQAWQALEFERQRTKWLREHPVEVPVLRSASLAALLEPVGERELRKGQSLHTSRSFKRVYSIGARPAGVLRMLAALSGAAARGLCAGTCVTAFLCPHVSHLGCMQ